MLILYYTRLGGFIHIARTTIAGCKTECGLKLEAGQPWTRTAPPDSLCWACSQVIADLLKVPDNELPEDET
jgi:hypothetical protein